MVSLRRARSLHRALVAGSTLFVLYFIWPGPLRKGHVMSLKEKEEKFPLFWQHLHLSEQKGGAWYIPPSWMLEDDPPPATLNEAAYFVAKYVNKEPKKLLQTTAIPAMIHQTWWSTKADDFSVDSLTGIEKWLGYATQLNTNMAYFMWTDDAVKKLILSADQGFKYGGEKVALVDVLPKPVEIADVFRVVVCNTIGGVYADIDTIPLRAPIDWVSTSDVMKWTDPVTKIEYGSHGTSNASYQAPSPLPPVNLILGIEADTQETSDTYWRMGYTYSVQLTQWALAASPKQPLLNHFLTNFRAKVQKALDDAEGTNKPVKSVLKQDPLELTGPAAITKASIEWLREKTGIRWQALSGLHDGGKSKVVLDTLILPITGFSPGRGKYGNMGSKALTDPDARVQHKAQGSWRKFHPKVELGKACRTILGMCKDWSKVAE